MADPTDDLEQEARDAIAEGRRAEARLVCRGQDDRAWWQMGRTRGVELALTPYLRCRAALRDAIRQCLRRARRHDREKP